MHRFRDSQCGRRGGGGDLDRRSCSQDRRKEYWKDRRHGPRCSDGDLGATGMDQYPAEARRQPGAPSAIQVPGNPDVRLSRALAKEIRPNSMWTLNRSHPARLAALSLVYFNGLPPILRTLPFSTRQLRVAPQTVLG